MNKHFIVPSILLIILSFICLDSMAQSGKQCQVYSVDDLKRNRWVVVFKSEGKERKRITTHYTDKEVVNEISFHLPDREPKNYVHKQSYYLSNGKANKFDKSKVGKVKSGTFIICEVEGVKGNPNQFVSQEIIRLNDQELSLYWCSPKDRIGGCDTMTWTNEKYIDVPPLIFKKSKK